jgi:hypothetical protein
MAWCARGRAIRSCGCMRSLGSRCRTIRSIAPSRTWASRFAERRDEPSTQAVQFSPKMAQHLASVTSAQVSEIALPSTKRGPFPNPLREQQRFNSVLIQTEHCPRLSHYWSPLRDASRAGVLNAGDTPCWPAWCSPRATTTEREHARHRTRSESVACAPDLPRRQLKAESVDGREDYRDLAKRGISRLLVHQQRDVETQPRLWLHDRIRMPRSCWP